MTKELKFKNLSSELKQIWSDKLVYHSDNILVLLLKKLDEKNQLDDQIMRKDINQTNLLLQNVLRQSTIERFQEMLKSVPEEKIGKSGYDKKQSEQMLHEAFNFDIMNSKYQPKHQEEVYNFLVDENFAKQRILRILNQPNKQWQGQPHGQSQQEYWQQQGQQFGNQYQKGSQNNSRGPSQNQQEQVQQQFYGGQNASDGSHIGGDTSLNQQNQYPQYSNSAYQSNSNNPFQHTDPEPQLGRGDSNFNDGIFGNEYDAQMSGGGDNKGNYRQDAYFDNYDQYNHEPDDIGSSAQNNTLGYSNLDQQYLAPDHFMGTGDVYKQDDQFDNIYPNDIYNQGYRNPNDIYSHQPPQSIQNPIQQQNSQQNQRYTSQQQTQQQNLPHNQTQNQLNQGNNNFQGAYPQNGSPPQNINQYSGYQQDGKAPYNQTPGTAQNLPNNNYTAQQNMINNKIQQPPVQDQYNYQQQQPIQGQALNEQNNLNQIKPTQSAGPQQNLDQLQQQQYNQQQQKSQQQQPQFKTNTNTPLNSSMQKQVPNNQQPVQKQPQNQQLQQQVSQQQKPQQGGLNSSQQQQPSLHNSVVGRTQAQQQTNQPQQIQTMFKLPNQESENQQSEYNTQNTNQSIQQNQLNGSVHQLPTGYPQNQQQSGLQAYQSLNESNHSMSKGANSSGLQNRGNNKTGLSSSTQVAASQYPGQNTFQQNPNQPGPSGTNQNPSALTSSQQQYYQQNGKYPPNMIPQQPQNMQGTHPNQNASFLQNPQQQMQQHQQQQQQSQYKAGGLNNSAERSNRTGIAEEGLKGSYHKQNPQQFNPNYQQSGSVIKGVQGNTNPQPSNDLKSSYQQQHAPQNQQQGINQVYNQQEPIQQKQGALNMYQIGGGNKQIPPIKQDNMASNQYSNQPYVQQQNNYQTGQLPPQQIDPKNIPTTQPGSKANIAKSAQQQQQHLQGGQNLSTSGYNQSQNPQNLQQQIQQQKRDPALNSSMQGAMANPQDPTQQQQYQQGAQNLNNGNNNKIVEGGMIGGQGFNQNGKIVPPGINNKNIGQPQQIQQQQQNQQIQMQKQQQQGVGQANFPPNMQIQNKGYGGNFKNGENNSPQVQNMNESSSTMNEQQQPYQQYSQQKPKQLNQSLSQSITQEYPQTQSTGYPPQQQNQKNPNNQFQMDPNNPSQMQYYQQKGANPNGHSSYQQYPYSQNDISNPNGNPHQMNPQSHHSQNPHIQQETQGYNQSYPQTKVEEPIQSQNQQSNQQYQQWVNQQNRNPKMQGKQGNQQQGMMNQNNQQMYPQNQYGNQMMKQQNGQGYYPQNSMTSMNNIDNDALNSSQQYKQTYDNSKIEEGLQQPYSKNDMISSNNIDQYNNNGSGYINQGQNKQYQMARNMQNPNIPYGQEGNIPDEQILLQDQQGFRGRSYGVQQQNQNLQSSQPGLNSSNPNDFKKNSQDQTGGGAQVMKWQPNQQGLNQDEDLCLIKDVFSSSNQYDPEIQKQITSDVQKFKQNNQNLTIKAIKMESEPSFKLEIRDKKRKDFRELVLKVMPKKDQPYEIVDCKNQQSLNKQKVPKTNSLMDIIKFWWKFEFQTIEDEKKQGSGGGQMNMPNQQYPNGMNGTGMINNY